MKAVKVDDYTVDFVLTSPNPILHAEWDTWYMFSKKWAEANGATQAQAASATSLNPFALKANGTGPFTIVSHEPGVKTVFKPNPSWWGKPEHNLDRGHLPDHQVGRHAGRGAAVRRHRHDGPGAGQDIDRLKSSPNVTVMIGPEIRTIFLNMDSMRDELLYSSVKGKNPFKDARVRKAFYQAIDMEAIHTKVMRGMSVNSALLISPLLYAARGRVQAPPLRCGRRQEAVDGSRLSRAASRSSWTARTTATSTTRASARPWRRCSRASTSR